MAIISIIRETGREDLIKDLTSTCTTTDNSGVKTFELRFKEVQVSLTHQELKVLIEHFEPDDEEDDNWDDDFMEEDDDNW